MAGILAVIWGDREQVYFCGGDWTGQIGLKLLRKIAFWRAGNSRLVTPPSPLSTPQMSHRPHCALFHASPSCGFRPGLEEFEGGSCDDDYWANSITHSHHRSAVRFAVVDGEEEPNKAEQQVRVLDFSYPPSVRSPTIESLDEAEEEQLRTECKYADAPNDEQRYECRIGICSSLSRRWNIVKITTMVSIIMEMSNIFPLPRRFARSLRR